MNSSPNPRQNRRRHAAEFDSEEPLRSTEMHVRPGYAECDPMGVVHHSTYAIWFEMGRTEMLRGCGGSYRDLEASGIFLVVADLAIRFRRPARYDDALMLHTHLLEGGRARLRHGYTLLGPDETTLATATSTLACVDGDGNLQPIPDGVAALMHD